MGVFLVKNGATELRSKEITEHKNKRTFYSKSMKNIPKSFEKEPFLRRFLYIIVK